MLSIIVPVRNEIDGLDDLIDYFNSNLNTFTYEVLIINDFSEDDTLSKAQLISNKHTNFKIYDNKKRIRWCYQLGYKKATGDFVSIMMADQSDDIKDLIKYVEIISTENLDAVFGSRFLKNSKIRDYPTQKLILNRIFNLFVGLIFWNKYNDYTNAFKIYKTSVLKEILPLVSESFNIFLELPLKIISRNYNYKIIPINWIGRKKGQSKFKIKELGSQYLFTLIYCFIEKLY